MIIAAVIVLALWTYEGRWLHPYLIALLVLGVVIGLVMAWRYVVRNQRVQDNWPSRSEYRWQPGYGVQTYHRLLLTWLKTNDWKILAAEAVDNDRLLLMVTRDKHRLPLLLLRPGLAADETEIARLRDVQQREGAWEAALIAEGAPAAAPLRYEGDATLMVLDYTALPNLSDALDGGPEGERRRRAALEALVLEEERKAAEAEKRRAAQAAAG